ncbi:MAG: hypothetical protein NW220_22060, partial [Leptolyngbyaceae cyanobacterium bins.349]|nr:hypothetical protein [Leptolyngbyaceae cyanobacterium bins.349]
HCIAPVVPSGGGVGDAAVLHVGGLGGATLQGKDIGFYPGLERRPNLCVHSSLLGEKGWG